MTPPPCACGETATGLVVEGHLHPYCAWQAERARAERLVAAIEDADVAFAYRDATPVGDEGVRDAHIDAAREVLYAALAADREGRS